MIEMSAYPLHVLLLCFSLLDGSICTDHDARYFCGTHISLLHAGIVAHMQDSFSEFHRVMVRTHRLLWSLHKLPLRSSLGPDIMNL